MQQTLGIIIIIIQINKLISNNQAQAQELSTTTESSPSLLNNK